MVLVHFQTKQLWH